jgi:hypothetical protein
VRGIATPAVVRSPTSGAALPRRRRTALALAAGVGLIAFIVGSFLVRFVQNPGNDNALDVVLYFYPVYAATYDRIAQLHVPLWNPFQLCGVPWLATLQGGFFYPTHLLYVLLPLHWAFEICLALSLVIAGVAMAVFARRVGLSGPAALLGAILFSLRGWVPGALAEPNALEAIVWLPLGALAVVELARGGGARATALLAVAVGLSFLAGYPQPTVYSLYTYASLLAAMLIAERAPARRALVAVALAAAGVALGMALAAVQLSPTAELLRFGGARATDPLELKAMMRFPQLAGMWLAQMLAGSPLSVGAVAWGLCLAAPFAATTRKRWLGLWALLLVAATAVAALGPGTRFFAVYLALPGLSWFRNPQRILVVTDFGVATAAAVGLDAVARSARRAASGSAAFEIGAAPLAALVGTVAAVVLGMGGFTPPAVRPGLWLFAALGTVVLLLAMARLRGVPSAAIGALLLLLATTEISLAPAFPWRLPIEDTDIAAYARSEEPLQAMQALVEPQRVWVYGASLSVDSGPKVPTRFGLRAINDYEPVSLARQAQYFRYLTEGSTTITREPWVFLGDLMTLTSPDGVAPAATRRRLLDLAAMRYLIIHPGVIGRDDASRAFPVDAGLVRRADLWPETEVWENPHALPRAYVTYRARPAPARDDLLREISQESYDPLAWTYVEGAPSLPAAEGAPERGAEADITVDTERIVEVEAQLDAPGFVVLADTAYPGWKATVDGAPAPIYIASFLFRAVPVPAGRHTVRFEYRPTSVAAGVALSAIAALGCLALVVMGGRRGAALSS